MNREISHPTGRMKFMHVLALVICSLALFLTPNSASHATRASTVIVDTLIDESDGSCIDGDCSLRDAIATATGGDTISFAVTGAIVLSDTLGTLTIDKNLTIAGPGPGAVTLDGNNSIRVLQVNAGMTLDLLNIVIARGWYYSGAGIYSGGTLNVSASTFTGNHAVYGSSEGGAIHNDGGTLTIDSSTFYSNSTTSIWSYGGAIYNDHGTVIITNTTFASNTTDSELGEGGGIYSIHGVITVTNSTFAGNYASDHGGAIYSAGGSTTLRNTILADSPSGGNCVGSVINGGNNIDSGTSCGWGSSNGSMSDTDPQLGPLADNGGATQTFALLEGSPAIDGVTYSAPNGCPAVDQRGWVRPSDGDRNGSAVCDIGAYELPATVYLPLVLKNL